MHPLDHAMGYEWMTDGRSCDHDECAVAPGMSGNGRSPVRMKFGYSEATAFFQAAVLLAQLAEFPLGATKI